MDRAEWLADRRGAVERSYTLAAPTYDEGYDPATAEHRRFVTRLIDTCPPARTLEQARMKHPGARFELIGLQELAFDSEFDAAMCVDAMENIPPEEWPLVLANFRRALRPGGHLYLTVEEIERREIDAGFEQAMATGLPGRPRRADRGRHSRVSLLPGSRSSARMADRSRFGVVNQADEWLDGYGYHHLLLRAGALGSA